MSRAGDDADRRDSRPGARDQTRSRVVAELRRSPKTLDQLVATLGLTRTAVRLQLATLERDGRVVRGAIRPGRTKPSQVYELTVNAEHELSRAYIPLLTQLLHVLSRRLSVNEFDSIMRSVGQELVAARGRPTGSLETRVQAASELLNGLGGLTQVEKMNGALAIQSHGCPLAATAVDHPETCSAMESLVGEFIGAPVAQHCDRRARPRCRFEIGDTIVDSA